jgi:hypothetical protein
MYQVENGEKKWKPGNEKLLKGQILYQNSIEKQFDGVTSDLYEKMPPSVG